MLRRGLDSLDELDAEEVKEAEEKLRLKQAALPDLLVWPGHDPAADSLPSGFDLSSVDWSLYPPPDGSLVPDPGETSATAS